MFVLIFISSALDVSPYILGEKVYIAGIYEGGWRAFVFLLLPSLTIGPGRIVKAIATQKLYIAFLLFGLAMLFRSPAPFAGVKTWLYLLYPFWLFALVLAAGLSARDLRLLVAALIFSGLAFQVITLALAYAGRYTLYIKDSHRLVSLPFFFGTLVILGYFLLLNAQTNFRRVIYTLLIIVFSGLIIWTGVRIVMLGAGVALLSILALRKQYIQASLLLIILLGLLAILPEWLTRLGGLNLFTWLTTSRSLEELVVGSFGDRVGLWTTALNLFFEPSPLIGSGLGIISQLFGHIGSASFEVTGGLVHSEYVRLLSEVGLIGTTLFVLSLLALLYTCWRAYRLSRSNLARTLTLAAFGSLVTYLVGAATDNVLFYYYSFGGYVWALVAMGLTAQKLDYKAQVDFRNRTERKHEIEL